MMQLEDKFFVGRDVYAKLKGFPPWPAKIESISNGKAKVVFYGSKNEWAIVSLKKLSAIAETDIYRFYGKNKVLKKVIDEWLAKSLPRGDSSAEESNLVLDANIAENMQQRESDRSNFDVHVPLHPTYNIRMASYVLVSIVLFGILSMVMQIG